MKRLFYVSTLNNNTSQL